MKNLYTSVIFIVFLYSCSPRISSTIISKQPPLSSADYVLVFEEDDDFKNEGIEIGFVKAGDNGFSSNCSYDEVIDKLKETAKAKGANVLKITRHKAPGAWSSCHRFKAKMYNVPDYRKYEKEILWVAGRRLAWEDFKGKPGDSTNQDKAAITSCGFGFQTNKVKFFNKPKIVVRTTFSCNLSWVRPDQINRTDLLQHEQGHFDLSEVYARLLRKKLRERNLTVFNLNTITNSMFKEVYGLYLQRQELYEKETGYGLNLQRQMDWGILIEKELNDLQDYAI